MINYTSFDVAERAANVIIARFNKPENVLTNVQIEIPEIEFKRDIVLNDTDVKQRSIGLTIAQRITLASKKDFEIFLTFTNEDGVSLQAVGYLVSGLVTDEGTVMSNFKYKGKKVASNGVTAGRDVQYVEALEVDYRLSQTPYEGSEQMSGVRPAYAVKGIGEDDMGRFVFLYSKTPEEFVDVQFTDEVDGHKIHYGYIGDNETVKNLLKKESVVKVTEVKDDYIGFSFKSPVTVLIRHDAVDTELDLTSNCITFDGHQINPHDYLLLLKLACFAEFCESAKPGLSLSEALGDTLASTLEINNEEKIIIIPTTDINGELYINSMVRDAITGSVGKNRTVTSLFKNYGATESCLTIESSNFVAKIVAKQAEAHTFALCLAKMLSMTGKGTIIEQVAFLGALLEGGIITVEDGKLRGVTNKYTSAPLQMTFNSPVSSLKMNATRKDYTIAAVEQGKLRNKLVIVGIDKGANDITGEPDNWIVGYVTSSDELQCVYDPSPVEGYIQPGSVLNSWLNSSPDGFIITFDNADDTPFVSRLKKGQEVTDERIV